MLACRLPVVAADIGAMPHLFRDSPECLYRSGDAADLADKLEAQVARRRIADVAIEDWSEVIGAIEPRIRRLVNA
jgi:glycosyltransferase involved in cell wall biosynthesis